MAGCAGERLRRWERLRGVRDFERVRREGRRLVSPGFVVLVAPPGPSGSRERGRTLDLPGPVSRLGVTVSRRVGKAVVRNRVKRGVREWFRRSRSVWEHDVDVVVIARPRAAGFASPEIAVRLSELLRAEKGRP